MKITHYHVWAENSDGDEYINTIHKNRYNAAFIYLQIVRKLAQQTYAYHHLTVEQVVNALDGEDPSVVVWTKTIFLKVAGCSGECFSPTWN